MVKRLGRRVLLPVAFWLAVWELCYRAVGQDLLLASPGQVVAYLAGGMNATFWGCVGMSLVRTGAAYVLGVVLGVTLVPRLDMRKQAKQGQNTVKVRLYEKELYADTAQGSRKISLQGAKVKTVGKKTQLTAVLPEDGGLLLIPVRAIPKDVRGRALSLLLQNN